VVVEVVHTTVVALWDKLGQQVALASLLFVISLNRAITMEKPIYRLYGIDVAMELLRPEAKWEISNNVFTRWDDPRPCPSMEEVYAVMDLSKKFEDEVNTIWLPGQVEDLEKEDSLFESAIAPEVMH
jgi:hypothetical protein|tara:strand:+ start:1148 stop:1528 length:381 start_codon:yes stop_codon:yes gene_type:complete